MPKKDQKNALLQQPFKCNSCRYFEDRKTIDKKGYCYQNNSVVTLDSESCYHHPKFDQSISDHNWNVLMDNKRSPVIEKLNQLSLW